MAGDKEVKFGWVEITRQWEAEKANGVARKKMVAWGMVRQWLK